MKLSALTLKFIFFFQAMKISYLPQPFLSIMDSRKQYSLGFLYSISSFLLNPPFLRDLSIVIGSVCSFLFQCILSTWQPERIPVSSDAFVPYSDASLPIIFPMSPLSVQSCARSESGNNGFWSPGSFYWTSTPNNISHFSIKWEVFLWFPIFLWF